VRDGLGQALATDGPVVVDVLSGPNALATSRRAPPAIRRTATSRMPPKLTGSQVRGFALAMTKTVLSGDAERALTMARSNLRNLPRP
jgi:pyruvate dehydrogenase (quinone)